MSGKKILLAHLNSNGDCLYATVVARQIKEVDYPNCHLTWAVNSRCRQSVELNPYVDEIWEIPTEATLTNQEEWKNFIGQVERRKRNGDFDEVFITQIIGGNELKFDGGIRSSTYKNYPRKIVVPHEPVIRLSSGEVENVRLFAEKHRLNDYDKVILVECAPESFSVALNPQSSYDLAAGIISESKEKIAVILSSNKQIASAQAGIIDASGLSFRENAELTKYCDLFVGCSSGISWLATSDWAKKLDMILVINQDNVVFPSMIYDHDDLGLPTNHIIEIKNDASSIEKLKRCVKIVLSEDFARARRLFNEKLKSGNYLYLSNQIELALSNTDFRSGFAALERQVKRNGIGLIFNRRFGKIFWELKRSFASKLLNSVGLRKRHD